MRFTVLVAKGLEEAAAGELRGLNLAPRNLSPGALCFESPLEDACRAVLHLRSARRVLLNFGEFTAGDKEAYYESVLALPWEDVLTPEMTFAVEASVRDSFTGHSGYAALKAKDAIADRCREKLGSRPGVSRDDPDMLVFVRLAQGHCSVGLDLAGAPLHKRGYREASVRGALNETLAAGILLLLGYDGERPFCDPFCGSGTFAVEAALMAARVAPGLLSGRRFGFARWPGFNDREWRRIVKEAMALMRTPGFSIAASDIDGSACKAARTNAAAAGVEPFITVAQRDALDVSPPGENGLIATNPPYGDHAGDGEDLPLLYKGFGDSLKKKWPGWTVAILGANVSLLKAVGLHPARRIHLTNGPAEARLHVFELYEGTKRKRLAETTTTGESDE